MRQIRATITQDSITELRPLLLVSQHKIRVQNIRYSTITWVKALTFIIPKRRECDQEASSMSLKPVRLPLFGVRMRNKSLLNQLKWLGATT